MLKLQRYIIEDINIKRRFLQPGYLARKYQKGYIKNPNIEHFVNSLVKVLDLVYPDLWDIQFNYSGIDNCMNMLYVIIHYPKLTVTNSKNQSTNIQDLYVRIPIEIFESGFMFKTIQGCRTTRNWFEHQRNYSHSHLIAVLSTSATNFNDFCTGEGEINLLTPQLSSHFSEDLFQLYLLHLENFVSWESLEGNPYINLDCLTLSEYVITPIVSPNVLEAYYSQFLSDFKDEYYNYLNWTINKGRYKILENNNLDILFRKINFISLSNEYIFGLKDSNGNIVKAKHITELNNLNLKFDNSLLFKAERKTFKLVADTMDLNNIELFLNPSIKNYIIKQLENEYNKKCITNYILTR